MRTCPFTGRANPVVTFCDNTLILALKSCQRTLQGRVAAMSPQLNSQYGEVGHQDYHKWDVRAPRKNINTVCLHSEIRTWSLSPTATDRFESIEDGKFMAACIPKLGKKT